MSTTGQDEFVAEVDLFDVGLSKVDITAVDG